MPLEVVIVGGGTTQRLIRGSDSGELFTRPFAYSDPQFQAMDLAATAYNFFSPKVGEQFVITDIVAFADRDVTTQTQLDIYEADSVSSTTIDKQILRLDIAKLTESPHHGILWLVNEGKFLNAKHDDDDIFLTIAGYYVPLVRD